MRVISDKAPYMALFDSSPWRPRPYAKPRTFPARSVLKWEGGDRTVMRGRRRLPPTLTDAASAPGAACSIGYSPVTEHISSMTTPRPQGIAGLWANPAAAAGKRITAVDIPQKRDEIAARSRPGSASGRPPDFNETLYKQRKSRRTFALLNNGEPRPPVTTNSPSTRTGPDGRRPASPRRHHPERLHHLVLTFWRQALEDCSPHLRHAGFSS